MITLLLGCGGAVVTGLVAAVSAQNAGLGQAAVVEEGREAEARCAAWNAPRQLAYFHDRRNELAALEHELGPEGTGIAVLHGVAGVGKSSIAAAYAARHRESLDVCWWVNASKPYGVVSGLASLGYHLGVSAKHQQAAARAALKALRGRRWLLVFDDAASPDVLGSLTDGLVGGHVLVTSRNPSWWSLARTIPVTPFDQQVAESFLLAGTCSTDRASAATIARCLDGLPLALDMVVRHSNECGRSLKDLSRVYQSDPVDALCDQSWAIQGGVKRQMPWDVSLAELTARSRVASELLTFMAFSQPNEPVPRQFLEQAAGHLPAKLAETVRDPSRLDREISLLFRMALVQLPRPGELMVHQLIQGSVRKALGRRRCHLSTMRRRWRASDWILAWVQALAEAYEAEDHTYPRWQMLSSLAIHGENVLAEASEISQNASSRVRLSVLLAKFHLDRGALGRARSLAVNAVACGRSELGSAEPRTVDAKRILGWILHILHEYDASVGLLEQVVDARRASLGDDHPDVLEAMNNLAGALVDRGAKADVSRGHSLHRYVYTRRRTTHGDDHPLTLISLHNLCSALLAQGAVSEARAGYERVLHAQRAQYGEEHPRPLIVQHRLSQVMARLGDLAGAIELAGVTLAARRRALGDHHPETVASMVQFADLLAEQGSVSEATSQYRNALKLAVVVFGAEHRELTQISDKLSRIA